MQRLFERHFGVEFSRPTFVYCVLLHLGSKSGSHVSLDICYLSVQIVIDRLSPRLICVPLGTQYKKGVRHEKLSLLHSHCDTSVVQWLVLGALQFCGRDGSYSFRRLGVRVPRPGGAGRERNDGDGSPLASRAEPRQFFLSIPTPDRRIISFPDQNRARRATHPEWM